MGGGQFDVGEAGETRVAGAEVPGALGAAKRGGNGGGAVGVIACCLGDEVGRIDADGHALDVERIGGCPRRGGVDAKAHLRVEVVEGQLDVANACLAARVNFLWMGCGNEVVVATIVVAL